MRGIARTSATVVLGMGLLSSIASGQAESARESAVGIAKELAEFGYEVDLDLLTVESASPRKVKKDFVKQLTLLTPGAYFEVMCELMLGLGLWVADSPEDLLKRGAKELSSFALAYYRPDADVLVVMENPSNVLAKVADPDFIVTHELVHAWRDQESDLVDLMRKGDPTAEELGIRQCLSEGEAQFVATAVIFARTGASVEDLDAESLEGPLDQMFGGPATLPYSKGAALALHLWHKGGWEAVRAIWQDPPTSTEQILHLEKLGTDLPREVPLPDWPLEAIESELLHDNCLGEMGLFSLLRVLGVEREEAQIAAAGWDGDRLRVYRTGEGETALVWRTVWDREEDARQFVTAMFAETDGEFSVRGAVVDWVRTVDGSLAPELLDAIAADGWVPEVVAADAAGTAALESSWKLELGDDPFLDQERWVHPEQGLSFAVPEDWRPVKRGSMDMLMSRPTIGGVAMNLIVLSLPNPGGGDLESLLEPNSKQFEAMGFEVDTLEIREVAGREMIWARAHGTMQVAVRTSTLIFLDGLKQVVVSATVAEKEWPEKEELVDELFASLRFGIEGFERPEEIHQHEVTPPEIPESKVFSLVVGKAGGKGPCRLLDVWVVREDGVRKFGLGRDQSRNEELAKLRGRRFRTNRWGRIDVPYHGDREFWFCARAGDQFGFGEVDDYDDEDPWLQLASELSVEVQVVDTEGKPIADVPVGFLVDQSDFDFIAAETVTKGRKGRAEWHHVISLLSCRLGKSDTVDLTFAFPCAEPPRVRVWPSEEQLDSPVLQMPETGSVLVRFEKDDEEDSFEVSSYGLGWRNDETNLQVVGADPQPFYAAPKVKRGERESDTLLFPFVGLGLELELELPFEYVEGTTFLGPVTAGERVEVFAKRQLR